MKLTINGNGTEVKDGLTVKGLLECLEIEPARVAVEVNLRIIRKDDFHTHELKDGDSVEIVNFVGGG
ncbi:MAG: sulfur carrier protein ThiS [Deferribacteres bacterium]|nr:sulfur carrier protein ThiS [Deferribacteres bacterium]